MKYTVGSIRSSIVLILAIAARTAAAGPQEGKEPERVVFAFGDPRVGERWVAVNDNVMGGVSDGRLRITDRGTLEFSGSVSLENNGGFASIRSRRADADLSRFDGLLVRVRGDGKRYDFNLRTDVRIMAGSYRAKFDTSASGWQEVYLPFADFEPTSFGRVRTDLPPLDPSKIRSFGLMISDKQTGPFALEVEWIKAATTSGRHSPENTGPERGNRALALRHWIEASISRGAPLYNAGESRLCSEVYTLTVRSLLCLAPGELPPQTVERLTAALQNAGQAADAAERAWVLRRALDITLESLSERAAESHRTGAQRNGPHVRMR